MNYYLYRHIRLDKNEVFYVGIGNSKRAYSKYSRNPYWHNIVDKTEYEIQVLKKDLSWEDACELEKILINYYGRKDLNTGYLTNMTNGGDGTVGFVFSNESKNKLRLIRKNRNMSHLSIKIYQYDLDGNFIKEWASITEAANTFNVGKSYLGKLIKNNLNGNFCKEFYWYYSLIKTIEKKKYRRDNRKGVIMINPKSNKIIKKFKTTLEAFKFFGKQKCDGSIPKAIRENRIVFGYKWKEVNFE